MDLNYVRSRRMQLAAENQKLMAASRKILERQYEIHDEDSKMSDIENILRSPISDASKSQILSATGIKGAEKFGNVGILPDQRSGNRMIKLADFYKRLVGRI